MGRSISGEIYNEGLKNDEGAFDFKDKDPAITAIRRNEMDLYGKLGVIDWGYLAGLDYYEAGWPFIAVLSYPKIHRYYNTEKANELSNFNEAFYNLQNIFINVLEYNFKGLSGLDGVTANMTDVSDNIAGNRSQISSVTKPLVSNISMKIPEKYGSPIMKYCDRYLSYISDPYTHLKNYSGLTEVNVPHKYYGYQNEVFELLYFTTEPTCHYVDKAFLLSNAQITSADYSELYEVEKGNVEIKEVTLNWSCSVITGGRVNKAAAAYLKTLWDKDNINLDSYNYDWTLSGKGGSGSSNRKKLSGITFSDIN